MAVYNRELTLNFVNPNEKADLGVERHHRRREKKHPGRRMDFIDLDSKLATTSHVNWHVSRKFSRLTNQSLLNIMGHTLPNNGKLYTHELCNEEQAISVDNIALCLNRYANRSIRQYDPFRNLRISLIACNAGLYGTESFAAKLLKALATYGIYADIVARTFAVALTTEGQAGNRLSSEFKKPGNKIIYRLESNKGNDLSVKYCDAYLWNWFDKVVDSICYYFKTHRSGCWHGKFTLPKSITLQLTNMKNLIYSIYDGDQHSYVQLQQAFSIISSYYYQSGYQAFSHYPDTMNTPEKYLSSKALFYLSPKDIYASRHDSVSMQSVVYNDDVDTPDYDSTGSVILHDTEDNSSISSVIIHDSECNKSMSSVIIHDSSSDHSHTAASLNSNSHSGSEYMQISWV